MVSRGKSPKVFLATTAFKMYLNAQRKRWQTENLSEGNKWPSYEQTFKDNKSAEAYRKMKLRKFASFPGGGKKMMIATGTLLMSVLGQGKGSRKIVTDRSLIVGTSIEYAKWVNINRPIFEFKDLKQKIKKEFQRWMMKGTA